MQQHIATHRRFFTALIASLFALPAACGGGGGGGAAAAPAPAAASFTKTAVLPAAPSGVSAGDWLGIFSSGAGSNRYQALVRAQDIKGSGPLRSLAFRFGAASAGNSCPNVTIKLVHRDVAAATLSTTFANNATSGRGVVTTVFGPATLTIPAGALGDYFTVPLRGAFNYNVVDKLIVDIESDVCTANTVLDAHDASPVYTALIWNVTDRTAPTGSVWNSLADMKFTFAGGNNAVLNTTGAAIGAGSPFTDTPGAARDVQFLYYASDINGSGPLTGIAFPLVSATTAESTFTVTLKLGHSTRAELAGHLLGNNNYSDTPVTVANNVSLSIPAGLPAGSYFWIPIPDGSFTYNGVDNLIVETRISASLGGVVVRAHSTGGPQTTSSTFIDPGTNDWAYDSKFRFAGGSLDAITPAAMTAALDSFPFRDTDGKRQYLYRAAELGTRGTITKIACRTGQGGIAETGFIYTVALSHGTAPTLGTTFATNLTSPVTVFNGTLNLPAVSAGDWVEIPLTTPFAYNGRDNLVLEIGGTGGAPDGFACASDNTAASATLYTGRRLYGATSAAATGSVAGSMIDTRFTLQ